MATKQGHVNIDTITFCFQKQWKRKWISCIEKKNDCITNKLEVLIETNLTELVPLTKFHICTAEHDKALLKIKKPFPMET